MKPIFKRIKNDLIYFSAKILIGFLRALPRLMAIRLMRAIGGLIFRMSARQRRKTIQHLTWAYGGLKSPQAIERLARHVFRHFSTVAVDAVRIPLILKQGINHLASASGEENLRQALRRGKGAIILTAHFGNWELMGAWIARNGYKIQVVASAAYDSRLDRMLVEVRNQAGYTNIARGTGTREIIRALHKNTCLGLLIDQDTNVEGVFVDFFNRPAHTPTGAVVLAQKLGAAIIPSFIHLKPDLTYHIEFQPELVLQKSSEPERDLVVNTQKCSDVIEAMIRRYPEQWVWMHKRWEKTPANLS